MPLAPRLTSAAALRWSLSYAWATLRARPGRAAAPIGVTAVGTTIVVVAAALYAGIVEGTVRWLRALPGDAVVASAEANPVLVQSFVALDRHAVRAVAALPGVGAVHELVSKGAWLGLGTRETFVQLDGILPDDDFGGPLATRAGRARPRLGEIVLDVVAADDLGARLGDRIAVRNPGGRTVTLAVAGISEGGNQVVGSQAFVSRATLALAGLDAPTHLFVESAPGTDAAALRSAIAAIPGVQVFSPATFVEQNLLLPRQIFRPMLGTITALVTAAAVLVIALVLRAESDARREGYALLGALGVPTGHTLVAVATWVLLTAGIGVVAGAATALGLLTVLPAWMPRLAVPVPPPLVVQVGAAAVALALAAAVHPLRAVARTDPGLVFRV